MTVLDDRPTTLQGRFCIFLLRCGIVEFLENMLVIYALIFSKYKGLAAS